MSNRTFSGKQLISRDTEWPEIRSVLGKFLEEQAQTQARLERRGTLVTRLWMLENILDVVRRCRSLEDDIQLFPRPADIVGIAEIERIVCLSPDSAEVFDISEDLIQPLIHPWRERRKAAILSLLRVSGGSESFEAQDALSKCALGSLCGCDNTPKWHQAHCGPY